MRHLASASNENNFEKYREENRIIARHDDPRFLILIFLLV
jgi:hypothetical protein